MSQTAEVGGAVETIGLDHASTAKLLGVSESHLHNLERTGRIGPRPFYLGRSKRYAKDEVVAWTRAKCPARMEWELMRRQ